MTTNCIECGAQLRETDLVKERLHALGYKARDDTVECSECGTEHTFGVPLDRETTEPPVCPVCGGRSYPYKIDFADVRNHLVGIPDVPNGAIDEIMNNIGFMMDVHWKGEDCFYFHRAPVDHLVNDVWSLGVRHLEGARDDA